MKPYRMTVIAEEDLLDIGWRRIRATGSVDRGFAVVETIESALDWLGRNPHAGHRRSEIDTEYRFWNVTEGPKRKRLSFLVVYDADTDPITIVRILHGSRDVHKAVLEG